MKIKDGILLNVYESNIKHGTFEIPKNATRIGNYAFSYCSRLASITIPDSVTSIGNGAFSYCSRLASITIPDSVTSIGDHAFYECRSLTSIIIPDGVTSIGDSAFSGCSSLTSITIPDSVTSIGREAFYGTAFYNNSSNWTDGVLYIGKCLIVANGGTISKDYTVKDGTVCIADYAFYDCSSLTNITIPDSVTSIGDHAFYECSSLKKLGKFKATDGDMRCRDYQYRLGEWYEEPEAILCRKGFHFCENAFDLFNYYIGEIGKDVRFFEVETDEVSDERGNDSKRVCKRIKLTREIKSYAELLS